MELRRILNKDGIDSAVAAELPRMRSSTSVPAKISRRQTEFVNRTLCGTEQFGSNLGPIAAENHAFRSN